MDPWIIQRSMNIKEETHTDYTVIFLVCFHHIYRANTLVCQNLTTLLCIVMELVVGFWAMGPPGLFWRAYGINYHHVSESLKNLLKQPRILELSDKLCMFVHIQFPNLAFSFIPKKQVLCINILILCKPVKIWVLCKGRNMWMQTF